jgi:hypothetical protein
MERKIKDIIDSELILRTNNFRLRKEYGEVGSSQKITTSGTSTVFTTDFDIHSVNYITVNGVNLIENVHYVIAGPNVIHISNSGSPVKKHPSITTSILVSYFAGAAHRAIAKIPPVINYFTLSKYSGKSGEIVFNFSIAQNSGKNIYWSILKDGDSTPLFSGNSLYTSDGNSVTNGVTTRLSYTVTPSEFLERQGEHIPFTLVVVYDLTEDGTHLDEKLLADASYLLEHMEAITGSIDVTPALISAANPANNIVATYNIISPIDSPALFDWQITKSVNGGAKILVVSGNQNSTLSGSYSESVISSVGQQGEIQFFLEIKESGATSYSIIANDKAVISVAAPVQTALAGYLDASIMSYIDPADGVRKKIGSLGTAQDLVEYNDRVPRAAFTLNVPQAYLTSNQMITPYVNTFGGTVTAVYFMIEVPDSWGAFDFYQTLGKVDITSFNKIVLGGGRTAYIYTIAPSSVEFPSLYYLKRP